MSAHLMEFRPFCPRCRKRRLPGRSKSSPFGDLLCDTCAKPSDADRKLAQIVNARITAKRLEVATQEFLR